MNSFVISRTGTYLTVQDFEDLATSTLASLRVVQWIIEF